MDILNISAPPGSIFTGTNPVEATPVVTKPMPQTPAPAAVNPAPTHAAAPPTADAARLEEVQKAAQAVQSNYYVVSDVRFTIFKDIAGEYVTRFTSLKDGHVTYYPQKSLLDLMKIKRAQEAAIFHTQA